MPKILEWAEHELEKEANGGQKGVKDVDLSALRIEKLQEEIGKIRANRRQAETALARERGSLVDAANVETDWAGVGAWINNAFANLPSQLVPLALNHGMPHQAAAMFQEQMAAAVTAILRKLSIGSPATEDDEDGPAEVPAGAIPA